MLDTLAKGIGVLMVLVVALILLNDYGAAASGQVPAVSDVVGNAVHEIGGALERIVQHGYPG